MAVQLLKRPLFFACSFAVVVSYICSLVDSIGMITLAAVLIVAFLMLLPSKSKLIKPMLVALVASLVVIGVNVYNYYSYYTEAGNYVGSDASVTGEVVYISNDYFIIKCESICVDGKKDDIDFKMGITHASDMELKHSTIIAANVVIDDECYRNEFRNVNLHAYASNVEILNDHNPTSLRYIIHNAREFVLELMPFQSDDTAAFVKATVLGIKDDISGIFLNMFNTIGLSHFLALSGLHLIFAVALVDFLMSLFSVGYRLRAIVAIVSILFFTFISGFSVSCVRAAIMMVLYYVGRAVGKIPDSLTSLAVSCFMIVALTPYNVRSLSFLLSSSATFGILFLYPCLKTLLQVKIKNSFINGFLNYVIRSFAVSLSATLMCLPILVFTFRSLCVISPVISVIIALPMQLIFYIGALGTLLSFVPFLGVIFSHLADLVYSIVELIVKKCYYIENVTISSGYKLFYFVFVLLIVVIIGIYIFFRTKKPRSVSFIFTFGYMLMCVGLFIFNSAYMKGKVNLHFVNVGQGSCSVITYRERASIIDCGGNDLSRVKQALVRDSVKSIDLIALTHSDNDHTNFIVDIMNTYAVDEIIVPYFCDATRMEEIITLAKKRCTTITTLDKNSDIDLYSGSKLCCFVEVDERLNYIKNLSAVYKFEMYGKSALFTGDIGVYQERNLMSLGDDLDVDIMLVPHHGSKTSSYPDFIKSCSPKYSIISVNKNNPYGLPDTVVVERYSEVSNVLTTFEDDPIIFQFSSKGYEYLNEH